MGFYRFQHRIRPPRLLDRMPTTQQDVFAQKTLLPDMMGIHGAVPSLSGHEDQPRSVCPQSSWCQRVCSHPEQGVTGSKDTGQSPFLTRLFKLCQNQSSSEFLRGDMFKRSLEFIPRKSWLLIVEFDERRSLQQSVCDKR